MSSLAEPSEYGSLSFKLPFGPVSLQSSKERKNLARDLLRKHLPKFAYLLSGDVSVEVVWMIHERERYESAYTLDIDNTLKVLIDAISGMEGVLVNDTQVQHLACSWIDWMSEEQSIEVTLKYMPDEYICKNGLIFLRMPNSPLCFPLNSTLPPEAALAVIAVLERWWELRNRVLERTGDYGFARYAMPAQRFFHSAHLHGYTIVDVAEAKRANKSRGGKGISEGTTANSRTDSPTRFE